MNLDNPGYTTPPLAIPLNELRARKTRRQYANGRLKKAETVPAGALVSGLQAKASDTAGDLPREFSTSGYLRVAPRLTAS